MADLGNRASSMRLRCKPCGWVPPANMTMQDAQLHFQVEHDTDDVTLDLEAACSCGEAMTVVGSRRTGGGVKDYLECGVCGNTGHLGRDEP